MKHDAADPSPGPVSKRMTSMKSPSYLPTVLRFSIGGYFADCHEVEFVAGSLRCRSAEGAYMFGPETIRNPSREQWEKFWQALEAAGVWSWAPDYADPGICDGTQWSLQLEHAGRTLSSEGSNAFPGADSEDFSPATAFGQFLSALRKLTGLRKLR